MISANANAAINESVVADRKGTFSDKPPMEVKVNRSPAPARTAPPPVNAAPASAAPSDAMSSMKYGAKQRLPVERPPVEAASAASDPKLEGAVIGVLGIEDLVRRTEDVCNRTLPTSYRRCAGSANGCRERNAPVDSQARRVLSQADAAAKRHAIKAAIRVANEQKTAPVVSAPMASKIAWRDRSSDETGKGVDVHRKHPADHTAHELPAGMHASPPTLHPDIRTPWNCCLYRHRHWCRRNVMAWSLALQRKAVSRQKQAIDTQNEAMERQKRALDQVQKSLELAQMQVENQQKMIALLEQICDQGRR